MFGERAVLALTLSLLPACDEQRPKARSEAHPAVALPPGASSSVGDSAKLDQAPPATLPERRLQQTKEAGYIVIESQGAWAQSCSVHRPCKVKPKELSFCAPGREAEAWSPDFAAKAEHFTDPQVAIRGQLVMSDSAFSTAVGCASGQCCNGRRADIVLAGPPYDLHLSGVGCGGDESRLCCPLSAQGEEVIVSGELHYSAGRLYLESPELCLTRK